MNFAGGMPCRRIGQQLKDRKRGDGFSRAGFSDQRQSLALADVERHPIDRQRLAPALAEGDRQIADREEGLGAHANVFRESKASRTASPMKMSSESMMATAKKPVSPSHGACTLALPWESNSPR